MEFKGFWALAPSTHIYTKLAHTANLETTARIIYISPKGQPANKFLTQ